MWASFAADLSFLFPSNTVTQYKRIPPPHSGKVSDYDTGERMKTWSFPVEVVSLGADAVALIDGKGTKYDESNHPLLQALL